LVVILSKGRSLIKGGLSFFGGRDYALGYFIGFVIHALQHWPFSSLTSTEALVVTLIKLKEQ